MKLPKHWNILPFEKAVFDKTGGNHKVKQKEYLISGELPVVDQGKKLISGYMNDENLRCNIALPCIIFGDHTRALKYVDFPFALGADGVKVLFPIKSLDSKFVYYYLKQLKLPDDAGYSRHFKFLKRVNVPIPPLEDQKRIVKTLDKADALRQKRRKAIELLDEYVKSVFLDMFGDPVTNPKGFPVGIIGNLVSEVKYGTSKKAGSSGEFGYLRMNNITYSGELNLSSLKYINLNIYEQNKYLVKNGDLLFNRTNSKELVGKTAVYNLDKPMVIAGYLIRVRANELALTEYISGYLNSKHGKLTLENMCKNIVGMANINAKELQKIRILIPPIDLQRKYKTIIQETFYLKQKMLTQAEELDTQFQALMQRAFEGELC